MLLSWFTIASLQMMRPTMRLSYTNHQPDGSEVRPTDVQADHAGMSKEKSAAMSSIALECSITSTRDAKRD
jgi:hypothetical protein